MNQHHSGSPTPNSGDISKGIDRVIEETVSKEEEEEEEMMGRGYHTIQTCSAPSGLPISVYFCTFTHLSYASVCVGLLERKSDPRGGHSYSTRRTVRDRGQDS